MNSYSNEKLEQVYINSQIKAKQSIYKCCEKLKWNHLDFRDNLNLVNLFERETKGILDIICESSWSDTTPIENALQ